MCTHIVMSSQIHWKNKRWMTPLLSWKWTRKLARYECFSLLICISTTAKPRNALTFLRAIIAVTWTRQSSWSNFWSLRIRTSSSLLVRVYALFIAPPANQNMLFLGDNVDGGANNATFALNAWSEIIENYNPDIPVVQIKGPANMQCNCSFSAWLSVGRSGRQPRSVNPRSESETDDGHALKLARLCFKARALADSWLRWGVFSIVRAAVVPTYDIIF